MKSNHIDQTKRNKIIVWTVSLVICSLFLLFSFLWGNLHYDSGDDAGLNLIAAGAYSQNSSMYLIFENYILGWLLKILYLLFPGVNCYLWFFVCMNCVALTSVSYYVSLGFLGISSHKDQKKEHTGYWQCVSISAIVSTVLNFFLAEEFYISLQFTKNAGLYAAAGYCLIWIGFQQFSNKSLAWIHGLLLCWIGFLTRQESFLAVTGIVLAAAFIGIFCRLPYWIHKKEKTPEKMRSQFNSSKKRMVIPVILVILIGGSYGVHKDAYSSEEWQHALEYSHYRSVLLDFGMPDYSTHIEAYNKLGIDETDIRMLSHWMYADFDKFSLETMRAIVSLKENKQISINPETAFNAIKLMIKDLFHPTSPVLWLIMLLLALFWRNSSRIWIYLGLTAGIFIEYYYYVSVGHIVWRVQMLPWLGAAFIFLGAVSVNWTGIQIKAREKTRSVVILTTAFVMMIAQCCLHYTDQKPDGVINRTYWQLHNNTDKSYLINAKAINTLDDIYSLDQQYADLFSNIFYTGGWTIPSPLWTEHLEAKNISNPIRDLVRKQDYYFIDNIGDQDLIRQYLEKETGQPITLLLSDSINGFNVWQFTAADTD